MRFLSFVLLLSALSIAESSTAQYRWDFGVNLGASNYLGEIGGQEGTRRDFVFDMKLNRTQYVFGGFARYRVSPTLALNGGVNYARIRGNDFNSQNPARVARNLSFRNNILEFSLRGEITLFYDNDAGGKGYYNPDFRDYAFGGVGVFHHNPRARYYGPLEEFNGELVELQPLKTEGIEYGNWQFTLPAGLGVYFTFLKRHRLGWELGYRTTFTDYLDDVSTVYPDEDGLSTDNRQLAMEMSNRTDAESLANARELAIEFGLDVPNAGSFDVGEKRGDATNNDGYLFTQFSYSYVLKGKSSFYKARYSYIKRKNRKKRKTRAKF
jgi:hypothetical protein